MPKGRNPHQQKKWDEVDEAIRKACWEKGSISSSRDLARRTGYSKTTIQKHMAKSIRRDQWFMNELHWKQSIGGIGTRGDKAPDDELHILRRDYRREIPYRMPSQSLETGNFLNRLVSLVVQSQLQSAFLGSLLEDPLNREKAELFIQCSENTEVPDKEYELTLKELIPPCRAFIIYSFDTELLVENLLQIWKEKKAKDDSEEALRDDLERFLERRRREEVTQNL